MATIEYRNVYKAFDFPVLSGVSLTVKSGETLAILGPSGTGKSVLLKTTNGLLVPDQGDVRIDGVSVYHSNRHQVEEIRRKVGYVFQYAALFDSMNVFENVCTGLPDGEARQARSPEVLRRVCEALEDVNLDPALVLNKLPSELSGGMRKRVGLARAIVGRPEILLYDEPVTGLDPVNTASVSRLILDIKERRPVTSIVVTHDVEGALEISDRVALLEHGKLRFVGTPHVYDLGLRSSGPHTLTIRVDNRMIVDVGRNAHSVTDYTQTAWNGVVGRIALFSTSRVWLADVQAYPDLRSKSVRLEVRIGNVETASGRRQVFGAHQIAHERRAHRQVGASCGQRAQQRHQGQHGGPSHRNLLRGLTPESYPRPAPVAIRALPPHSPSWNRGGKSVMQDC